MGIAVAVGTTKDTLSTQITFVPPRLSTTETVLIGAVLVNPTNVLLDGDATAVKESPVESIMVTVSVVMVRPRSNATAGEPAPGSVMTSVRGALASYIARTLVAP